MSEARPARDTGPGRNLSESAWGQAGLFRMALESVPDGIIVVDEQGKFLLFNAAAERILRTPATGVPPWRWTEVYGLYLPDTVTPYPPAELPLARALRGEAVELTEVFIRPAGAPEGIWTCCTATPLRDDGGALRGAVLMLRDVTRPRKLEEDLRKERDWAAAVMDTVGSLVMVLDRHGRVVSFNRACEELTGYPAREVTGVPFWDCFLPWEERDSARRLFDRIRAGDFPSQYENHWRTRAGEQRLIVWSNSALLDSDGRVEYVIGTGLDITDRKRAEERLREASETLRTLMEASPLPVWAHDLEGRVLFWNPAAERVFGWSEEEVFGRPLPIIPEDQQDDFRALLERYRQGETLRGLERRRRRKDGLPVDISIWSAPMRDSAGNIVAQLGIIVDVTERKLLEEQFRQAQKMEAVGRLAGGVAHDFNNLLMIMSGYGQMLLDALETNPTLREHVTEILKATESAAALTNRLLAFSRRQAAQPRVLDLNTVVQGMDKMLHRVIGEDIELTTSLAPNLGKVKVDPGQMEQVLMNLVVNSRDAMPEGGRITIETAPVRFDEEYARTHLGVEPGPHVMLAVSDTGKGMDAETRRHLFEPFFTTKEKGKGTGLGLSTVYGIIKQNSGEIWAYSEPGVGTTFKIYLPVAEPTAETAQAPAAPRPLAKGTETILLAEDQPSLRKLIVEILQREGYTVLEAQDAEQARRICERQPIHLFLTDVIMPQMSGRALAERLTELRPSLKVIYMSGYADNAIVRHQILDAGAVFLEKPFTPEMLLEKVREVLDAAGS